MKNFLYTLSSFIILALLSATTNNAQDVRVVPVEPFVNDGLYLTIDADSAARVNALPTQTIYELKRNGIYPIVTTIQNQNPFFYLHIRAEEGSGAKPLIVPSPQPDLNFAAFILFREDGKLENLVFEHATPTGGYQTRPVRLYNGASVEVVGCIFRHDRAAALTIQSDSCSLIIKDCIIHSMGGRYSFGDNGRPFEIRAGNYFNKVTVTNTTIFNISDRMFRNNGTEADSIIFDHVTVLNTQGYHGGMQPGPVHNLTVTNSIFYNNIVMGSRATETGVLTSQPEKNLQYVLSIDSVFADGNIKVRNNNIFWEQKYKDLWATIDTIHAPGSVTPTIMKALGQDSVNAYFSEELTFSVPPAGLYAFAQAGLADRTNINLPENFFSGPEDSLDLSYGTTAISYTAGDNGLPLGDLNWYPDKKAIWQTTSVERTDVMPTEFALEQNYPNPFNPATKIVYSITQASKVRLEVFDILGRLVTTLVDQEQQVGQYKVDFDGSKLSSGVYIYRLSTPCLVQSKKMMLMK